MGAEGKVRSRVGSWQAPALPPISGQTLADADKLPRKDTLWQAVKLACDKNTGQVRLGYALKFVPLKITKVTKQHIDLFVARARLVELPVLT